MRLYQRKRSPYWWADLRSYGLGQRSTGIRDEKQAEKYVYKYLASQNLAVKRVKGTLLELIQRYTAFSETRKTPKVQKRDSKVLDDFMQCVGPDRQIYGIGQSDIESWISARARAVKASTVNRDLNTVRHMFNMAVDWNYIDDSPCKRVKRLKIVKARPKVYSRKEVKKILIQSPSQWRKVWLIYLNTAMRREEATHVDMREDIREDGIHVRKPKEHKEKIIPVSDELAGILRKWPHKYLIPYDPDYVTRKFRETARAAGVAGNLHRLRHTAATHLLDQGVPIHIVKEILGHASIATTEIYLQALKKEMKKAVNRIKWDTVGHSRKHKRITH